MLRSQSLTIACAVFAAVVAVVCAHADGTHKETAEYAPSPDQYGHTINFLASHSGIVGTLSAEVIDSTNPVAGNWTVFRAKDLTGRLIEVHSRLPMPDCGRIYRFDGFVAGDQKSYEDGGTLYVFIARSQQIPLPPAPRIPPPPPIPHTAPPVKRTSRWFILAAILVALAIVVACWRWLASRREGTEVFKGGTERFDRGDLEPVSSGYELQVPHASSPLTITIPRVDSGGILTYGSAEGVDIQIPYPQVSAIHGELQLQNDQWWILGGQTTNKTAVNGTRLKPGDKLPLSPGDGIRIGKVRMEFQRTDIPIPFAEEPDTTLFSGGLI